MCIGRVNAWQGRRRSKAEGATGLRGVCRKLLTVYPQLLISLLVFVLASAFNQGPINIGRTQSGPGAAHILDRIADIQDYFVKRKSGLICGFTRSSVGFLLHVKPQSSTSRVLDDIEVTERCVCPLMT